MTRDDIEKWTSRAGGFDATPEFLQRFAECVAEAEREACAQVCEDDVQTWSHPGSITREECAAAIRARGEK